MQNNQCQTYSVLFMITVDQVDNQDLSDTIDQIICAAELPISVVIVAVG